MNLIIAGSRTINEYQELISAFSNSKFKTKNIKRIITGGADGVDSMAKKFALDFDLQCQTFLPDWRTYGKSAGPIRNGEMADAASSDGGLLLLWDGKSRGSFSMLTEAFKRNLEIYVHMVVLND